jgi:hypothetical protein
MIFSTDLPSLLLRHLLCASMLMMISMISLVDNTIALESV